MGKTSTSILKLGAAESSFDTAINSSIFNGTEITDGHSWAQTELKNSVETAAKNWAQQNLSSMGGSGLRGGPGDGITITVGIQLQLAYRVSFKAGLNVGYGKRYGNFAFNSSVHVGVYNGGLGTPIDKRNLTFDVTGAANIVVGWGSGVPLQSYALNYNTPIPMQNDFRYSLSFGQLFTWNSAINDNQFSLERLQREGMLGIRVGNFNISTNNDTKRLPYFGGGTDKGWTGGISIVTPWIEFGFQDFTGDYRANAAVEIEREEIKKEIEKVKYGPMSTSEKLAALAALEDKLKILLSKNYHTQSDQQRGLNKASTYLRFTRNGYSGTLDIVGDAWFQNAIHNQIKDLKFEYPLKRIEAWGGKSW